MTVALNDLRKQLDEIDRQLIESLALRQETVEKVASCKASGGVRIRDRAREDEVLGRLGEQARAAGLDPRLVETLYREIFDYSVRHQQRCLDGRAEHHADQVVVAYQGTTGAYSHLAAQRHFGAREEEKVYRGYETFREAFEAVETGAADYALLPIENSTAGAVNDVYDLLAQTGVQIVGEEIMRIEHCLLAAAPVSSKRLQRVLSHPQALAQCSDYLMGLTGCKAEPFADTAMAAEKIREDRDPSQAAIASEEAARRCGLHVIGRGIGDQKKNYTRFVAVSAAPAARDPRYPCKTSFVFTAHPEKDALMQFVKIIGTHDVRLTNLAQRPCPEALWACRLFVDLEGSPEDPAVQTALDDLHSHVSALKVLGTYPAHSRHASIAAPGTPPAIPEAGRVRMNGHARKVNHQKVEVQKNEPRAVAASVKASKEKPYRLAVRAPDQEHSQIQVGDVTIGNGRPVVMAGPCSVESPEQIMACARAVKEAGGHILRGGCFKPRTSPYSFQGLGYEGLDLLAGAGRAFGLPIVTEVMSAADLDTVAQKADILQIGARNMKNYALLKAVGGADRPVLLKRGMAATVDEWLAAAEYLLAEGNEQVILCERGIRTFERATRNTLDLTVLPVLKERTHLPVIVDPSHACGNRRWVSPLAEAALAAGADGLMVEVHPDPEHALSDGPQSLTFEGFERLVERLHAPGHTAAPAAPVPA